ncbi:glycosyltransferase family 8 protein, partial [Shimia sp.]|uniref:glycosyltransferase family 8 protein n=1 Tax=Shimia sp. TaxID=1954381 RepID=UPI00356A177C
AALGIRNQVLDLRREMEAENLPLLWLPLVCYLRLWLPRALAGRYDRILYTDADTYLDTAELSRLFEADLGPHVLAAVSDKLQWLRPDRPIIDFAELGLPVGRYLNSGVCLIDVARYNAEGLLARMLEIHRRGTPLAHHDQSLLNLALEGRWAELSPVWNWQWANAYPRFTARATPKIIHFGGPAKPWKAATVRTSYPAGIIATYQRFLAEHDLPGQCAPDRPGGRRYGPLWQIANIVEHLWALPAWHKLVARHPDPWKTRL